MEEMKLGVEDAIEDMVKEEWEVERGQVSYADIDVEEHLSASDFTAWARIELLEDEDPEVLQMLGRAILLFAQAERGLWELLPVSPKHKRPFWTRDIKRLNEDALFAEQIRTEITRLNEEVIAPINIIKHGQLTSVIRISSSLDGDGEYEGESSMLPPVMEGKLGTFVLSSDSLSGLINNIIAIHSCLSREKHAQIRSAFLQRLRDRRENCQK